MKPTLPLTLLSLLFLLPFLPLSTTHPTPTSTQTTLLTPGNATIHNTCPFPIYIWSVSSTTSPSYTITQYQNYTEPFRHDTQTGGVSLKITTVRDGLYTGSPQLIFAYNLVEEKLWFDLSDVFGDPFRGWRMPAAREAWTKTRIAIVRDGTAGIE
ncbi:hypothetical protein BO94DRAFT_628564 [Aspergillus sclerotioniger CBS 115572]|uniref:Uncharacterized protein n=1 Tax=Aspergillus sclerotioniger CBS 115572 TaxID=1450535 RepID=A0A317V4C1_9EURO|nr:hypothetical protein BO94DRAFT_628564 [Aspergillus sclerotioniger CBS 115572]PWY68945.1 hypothetical protein BO94DRAFT_628564 [Aspergillus sclerotioniger CBS 115572]